MKKATIKKATKKITAAMKKDKTKEAKQRTLIDITNGYIMGNED